MEVPNKDISQNISRNRNSVRVFCWQLLATIYMALNELNVQMQMQLHELWHCITETEITSKT